LAFIAFKQQSFTVNIHLLGGWGPAN